jgi:hypothetical protein
MLPLVQRSRKRSTTRSLFKRLYDVAADFSKNRAKLLETAIELSRGSFYRIQAFAFPSDKIIVGIVCSDNQFPIWLTDSNKTNKEFLRLLAYIRSFLLERIGDFQKLYECLTCKRQIRIANIDNVTAGQKKKWEKYELDGVTLHLLP